MIETLLGTAGPVALGAALGFLGGLLGIGGGIIAIPILALFFGMDQQIAQGTGLVMLTPNVLIGFWRYRQRNPIPLRTAGTVGLCAVLSTYPAALLAVALDPRLLKLCFAFFLGGLAIWFFRLAGGTRGTAARTPWNDRYLPVLGLIGGFFAGVFSVGSGIVAAPILVRGFGKPQAVAQGLALALVVPGALIALATFAHAGQVDWRMGGLLALGGMLTVSRGVALAHRLPESRLRRVFAIMLLGTAGLLVAQGLRA